MTLHHSMAAAAQYWFDKFDANKLGLGIGVVYYGDQERLASTPALCVEPDMKTNELKGATRRIATEIRLYFIIYHAKIQSPQANRREADLLAEAVETFLHDDPRMNETVIHSMVTRIESGYVYKENTLVRATRIAFEATTQAQLPN
jgi:hypothetical protein